MRNEKLKHKNKKTNNLKKIIIKKLIMKTMKNLQSKIKPIKVGKHSGTTYCFECKDYAKNFRPEKVKMVNQLLREKSHCVACWSDKSRFLKQKIY